MNDQEIYYIKSKILSQTSIIFKTIFKSTFVPLYYINMNVSKCSIYLQTLPNT